MEEEDEGPEGGAGVQNNLARKKIEIKGGERAKED